MKRVALIALLAMVAAGCTVPNFYGPDFSQPPRLGMTTAEVQDAWGLPANASSYSSGGHLYELWLYRNSRKVVMPAGRSAYSYRDVSYYSVHFRDGVVVGTGG